MVIFLVFTLSFPSSFSRKLSIIAGIEVSLENLTQLIVKQYPIDILELEDYTEDTLKKDSNVTNVSLGNILGEK